MGVASLLSRGKAATRPCDHAEELYDATNQIWLELFGEHVHVGYYASPSQALHGSSSWYAWHQAQEDHIRALLQVAGVQEAHEVADVGCGNGGTALLVARQLGCSVVGVNISPHQVQSANALAQRCGFDHSKLRFVVGDALEPPLPAGAFDLVLAVESSTYMPDKDKFVQQLARLARPGGTVVLADFCRKAGPLTPQLSVRMAAMDDIFATAGDWKSADDWKAFMAEHGLQVAASEDWSSRVRGFWRVPLLQLLFRQTEAKQQLGPRLAEGLARAMRAGLLMLTGGPKVLKMAWSLQSGSMARAVQRGLDSGDLEYHVIVGRKAQH